MESPLPCPQVEAQVEAQVGSGSEHPQARPPACGFGALVGSCTQLFSHPWRSARPVCLKVNLPLITTLSRTFPGALPLPRHVALVLPLCGGSRSTFPKN